MRRRWGRLPEPLREAALPFVVARVVVAGALGLAHFIVDRTHPSTPGVATRVHEGLLGWDAGWYESIARQGYAPLGHQSLRFFPAVPLLTHALAWVPGLGDGPALVLLANTAALAATAMLYLLARRETGSGVVARRSVWILSLLPAAFVLVMGYAESVLLVAALGCFLALRPPPSAGATRPHFAVAGLLAFAAALTRPIGVLLVLAVGAELVRWWPRLGRQERAVGLGAVAAPCVAVLCFLAWSKHVVGDWWAPLRVQVQSSHHGGLSDPFATLYHDARGVLHHHVGTALHVPWVLLSLAMLVVCWRRLPGALHALRRRRPGHRRGRFQPRLVRALRPQRLPVVDRRRPRPYGVAARALRPGPAGGRAGRLRAVGLPEHLGPLNALGARSNPCVGPTPSLGRHEGSTNLPCSWSPPKHPSSSPARAPVG